MASKKSASNKTLSMKLLVNSKTQRVLYAEGGKDVVDFLFSLLTMPVGTAAKLLTADSMVGSVGNLYSSVQKLDDTYISCDGARKALLTPFGGCGSDKLLQLQLPEPVSESAVLYRCNNGSSNCRNYVTKPLVEPADGAVGSGVPRAAGAGFVQGIVTYTVMDNLKVAPMSSISGITLLNTFGVTDIGSLKEKTVQLGYTEGLEILKASLQSKTVLTDVFLGKKTKE
ncbi:uncharacterized protein [Lolium perenne]|uniref:uncharacterized protein n=1 Tax=Lolium perenne TaxID=4522 RepID=UPI0021F63B66|nr:uncharacterized protein LOC127339287 [Lolium perenne]